MKTFVKRILSISSLDNKKKDFLKNFKEISEIKKIFYLISNYSDESEVRFVGGCIRKILNNEKVDDIDLATNIKPYEMKDVFILNGINIYETGIKHGTITALINNKKFEITSLRKDVATDGRHAKVEFSNNWYEDSLRRDFTINCIYADLDGNLYDPFNGKEDIKNGFVKFIGDAELRIKEDYLRILRYVRFFLNYSRNKHDNKVLRVIRKNINGIKKISKERLFDELKKIIVSKNFFNIVKDDFCTEVLKLTFPELKNIDVFKKLNTQSKIILSSKTYVFLISLMTIDNSDNTDYFFYKYNISNKDKNKINFLKENYLKFSEKNFFTEKNLSKIFYIYGKDDLIDLIDFRICTLKKVDKNLIKIKNIFNLKSKPIFPIDANELIKKYGLKEGRYLGQKLKEIENIWLNNNFKICEKDIKKLLNS